MRTTELRRQKHACGDAARGVAPGLVPARVTRAATRTWSRCRWLPNVASRYATAASRKQTSAPVIQHSYTFFTIQADKDANGHLITHIIIQPFTRLRVVTVSLLFQGSLSAVMSELTPFYPTFHLLSEWAALPLFTEVIILGAGLPFFSAYRRPHWGWTCGGARGCWRRGAAPPRPRAGGASCRPPPRATHRARRTHPQTILSIKTYTLQTTY